MLAFIGEKRTVAKETRLGTDLPETFTKANDTTAVEKKRKRNRKKKGKKELPDDAHHKWAPAVKQLVVAEVDRLTEDYDKPAYTEAVSNLRTKYKKVFTGGGRDLKRAQWRGAQRVMRVSVLMEGNAICLVRTSKVVGLSPKNWRPNSSI